jgi:hypothetical protein
MVEYLLSIWNGSFIINAEMLDVLRLDVSSIESLEQGSKLLVLSDYLLGW